MPYDKGMRITQYHLPTSVFFNRDVDPPNPADVSVSGLLIYNGNTTLPSTCLIGNGLVFDSGALSVQMDTQPHIDDAATDAPETLDAMTVQTLTDELNAANARYNALATKVNALLAAAEANGILADA